MGRATAIFFTAPWGPGMGSKGQISFDFNYKVNFKGFIAKFVCVLTKERYKTYQTGFSFCRMGHALGVGLGALWVPSGSKKIKHGHEAYQIDGDDEQNKIQDFQDFKIYFNSQVYISKQHKL